jgi:hypothetical protein
LNFLFHKPNARNARDREHLPRHVSSAKDLVFPMALSAPVAEAPDFHPAHTVEEKVHVN